MQGLQLSMCVLGELPMVTVCAHWALQWSAILECDCDKHVGHVPLYSVNKCATLYNKQR